MSLWKRSAVETSLPLAGQLEGVRGLQMFSLLGAIYVHGFTISSATRSFGLCGSARRDVTGRAAVDVQPHNSWGFAGVSDD